LIYIIDASAAVCWFVREDEAIDASFLLDNSIKRIAPDLIFSEVSNVIQRKVRLGQLTWERADAALATLDRLFDEVVPSQKLYRQAFDLSRKLDHSVYDCIYLAAALSTESGFLVTLDSKFLTKAKAAGADSRIHTLELAYARFVSAQENENG
jgi:predicted nucleic acid-binding protein